MTEEEKIVTDQGKEYTVEEIKHSKRIQKSATPKGTLDWYIKWVASIALILAVAMRSSGVPELHKFDVILSMFGIAGWALVGFIWRDRALIILNSVMFVMLFAGLMKLVFGHA